ncbi:hypothetical protein JCM8097_006278 [Rhodosporidiobolus ruineniae]
MDLDDRLDRLSLQQQQPVNGGQGGLAVPGQAQAVRKQRSQRFTVPTSPPSSTHPLPPLPTPSPYSLPYQPPPPPVQTQSIPPSSSFLHPSSGAHNGGGGERRKSFYSTRQYSSSGSSEASSLGFDDPSGQGTYPYAVAPGQGQQYRPHSAADFLAGPPAPGGAGGYAGPMQFGVQGQGAGRGPQVGQQVQEGPKRYNEEGDELIDTAIVIKSIPFSAHREDLLFFIQQLGLPLPFAFNYHLDAVTTQFRGLAFANYHSGEEAEMTVRGLNGMEFQGRKLRVEFKRALKPGEKEQIERTKALKRMRSAQLLATLPPSASGAGSFAPPVPAVGAEHLGPPVGWQRREASAPGGYPGFAPPPQAAYGQYGVPVPLQPQGQPFAPDGTEETDYGRPLLNGTFSSSSSSLGLGGGSAPPGSGPGSVRSFGARDFVPAAVAPVPLPHLPAPAPFMEPSYSSSPPMSDSDVGTSVSQRVAASAGESLSQVGTASTSASEGEGGASAVGAARAGEDLDLNDPTTLELYSRCLLFRDDPLRDELAFARALPAMQRRVVHVVARKLGLEHRSVGEGTDRHVVVWKRGGGVPSAVAGREASVRKLRQSASTAALRHRSSRDLLSASPTPQRSYLSGSPLPVLSTSATTPSLLSPSHSSSSLSTLSLPPGLGGLRGKKSMPDIRYSRDGHIASFGLAPPSSATTSAWSSAGGSGSHSPASSRSTSPIPPLPTTSTSGLTQSTSLAANLAAYSSGVGYASQSASGSGSIASSSTAGTVNPNGAIGTPLAASSSKRRSYASLRSASAAADAFGLGAGAGGSGYATFALATPTRAGGGGGRREREIPSVQGLFQAQGIAPAAAASSPGSGSSTGGGGGGGKNVFWAGEGAERKEATPVRMPRGPGTPGSEGDKEGEGLEWRRRA